MRDFVVDDEDDIVIEETSESEVEGPRTPVGEVTSEETLYAAVQQQAREQRSDLSRRVRSSRRTIILSQSSEGHESSPPCGQTSTGGSEAVTDVVHGEHGGVSYSSLAGYEELWRLSSVLVHVSIELDTARWAVGRMQDRVEEVKQLALDIQARLPRREQSVKDPGKVKQSSRSEVHSGRVRKPEKDTAVVRSTHFSTKRSKVIVVKDEIESDDDLRFRFKR